MAYSHSNHEILSRFNPQMINLLPLHLLRLPRLLPYTTLLRMQTMLLRRACSVCAALPARSGIGHAYFIYNQNRAKEQEENGVRC
jgi:hypothetical protein